MLSWENACLWLKAPTVDLASSTLLLLLRAPASVHGFQIFVMPSVALNSKCFLECIVWVPVTPSLAPTHTWECLSCYPNSRLFSRPFASFICAFTFWLLGSSSGATGEQTLTSLMVCLLSVLLCCVHAVILHFAVSSIQALEDSGSVSLGWAFARLPGTEDDSEQVVLRAHCTKQQFFPWVM